MTVLLVSLLLPCRGRPESTRRSLESLKLAADPTRVEVLVRCDDDDPETARIMQEPWPFRVRTFVGPRGRGYEDLHHMYNELATAASGTFLFLWNNDAVMMTPEWDSKLLPFDDGKLRYFRVTVTPNHQTLSFPIVHRSYIECLGRYSPWAHNDSHVFNVMRPFFGRVHQDIDISVHHDINDLLGTHEVVSVEGRSKWSVTQPLGETPEYQAELQRDRDKINAWLRKHGQQPTPQTSDEISLCIINRNNRDNLVRLLREARPWVHEIVVLDTGSTDGSTVAARAAGADIVVERPDLIHEDGELRSFAEARNESYKLATKPWQLWLDTDDTVAGWVSLSETVKQLREHRDDNRWGASVSLPYDYVWSSDRSKCVQTLVRTRITHRDDCWRWFRPIHEFMKCDQKDEFQVHSEELRIVHMGQVMRSSDRNLRILKRWEASDGLKEDPHTLLFSLGEEHFIRCEFDKAFDYLNRIAGVHSQFEVLSALKASMCLLFQNKLHEMSAYIRPFMIALPEVANFHWIMAYAWMSISDLDKARKLMIAANSTPEHLLGESVQLRDIVLKRLEETSSDLLK